MDTTALGKLNCVGATPAPDGFKYGCLSGYLGFVDAGVQGGSSFTVDHIKAVVPYLGGYKDIANGCGQNNSSSFLCLPDMNPEHASGSAIAAAFFETGANGGRILNTTNGGFTFNQSIVLGSGTGAMCGAPGSKYTSTNAQTDCTLNPVVPLPLVSPVSNQLDPNIQNERYRANYETQQTVVTGVANTQNTSQDNQYLASTGHAATSPYNYAFNDDSFDPGDSASYPFFYSWQVSPFALAPVTGAGYPYPNYNHTNFITGLTNSIAAENKNIIINLSGYEPDGGTGGVDGVALPAPASSVVACATNCLGAMQEQPFDNPFQNQNQPTANKYWASNVNVIIYLLNHGKNFISFDHATNTPAHTFAGAVVVGTQTVPVNTTTGIDPGTTFTTAAPVETVTVTALGVNTITATFANAHANGTAFTVASNGVDAGGLWVRRYTYASEMLAADTPSLIHPYTSYCVSSSCAGSLDGLGLPIEAEIVPYMPLRVAPPVYSSAAATTTGVYALEDTTQASSTTYACSSAGGPSTGSNCAFVREYQYCSVNGVFMGAGSFHGCAFVVMPNLGGTYKFPTLTQTYTHTANITGYDIHPGLSDSGSISITGVAPPAAGTLEASPNSWILTP